MTGETRAEHTNTHTKSGTTNVLSQPGGSSKMHTICLRRARCLTFAAAGFCWLSTAHLFADAWNERDAATDAAAAAEERVSPAAAIEGTRRTAAAALPTRRVAAAIADRDAASIANERERAEEGVRGVCLQSASEAQL